jgi:hypothetical protein
VPGLAAVGGVDVHHVRPGGLVAVAELDGRDLWRVAFAAVAGERARSIPAREAVSGEGGAASHRVVAGRAQAAARWGATSCRAAARNSKKSRTDAAVRRKDRPARQESPQPRLRHWRVAVGRPDDNGRPRPTAAPTDAEAGVQPRCGHGRALRRDRPEQGPQMRTGSVSREPASSSQRISQRHSARMRRNCSRDRPRRSPRPARAAASSPCPTTGRAARPARRRARRPHRARDHSRDGGHPAVVAGPASATRQQNQSAWARPPGFTKSPASD